MTQDEILTQSEQVRTHLDLYELFVRMRGAGRLGEVDMVQRAVAPHCKMKAVGWRGSGLRILQFPYEIAALLVWMKAHEVRSYLEIGTSTGGSFMLVDAYLRACFGAAEVRSLGLDVRYKLNPWWGDYQRRFPSAAFFRGKSTDVERFESKFDFGFIDAHHKEDAVSKDHMNVASRCRHVGFHDIYLDAEIEEDGRSATVYRYWRALRRAASGSLYRTVEFDHDHDSGYKCGIGIVIAL